MTNGNGYVKLLEVLWIGICDILIEYCVLSKDDKIIFRKKI